MSVNRRSFLKLLGASAATAPLAASLNRASADPADGPRRIIVLNCLGGIVWRHWNPMGGTGTSFTLPYTTEPLAPFRDRCIFISNIENRVVYLPPVRLGGHHMKAHSALTGTLQVNAFRGARNHVDDLHSNDVEDDNELPAMSESVDTFVGSALRSATQPRAAVNLGMSASPWGQESFVSRSFYEAGGSPATMIDSPAHAYRDLFAGVVEDDPMDVDPMVAVRQSQRSSVLDAVRQSFQDVRSGLDYRHRQRLDFHADYIRQIEIDLSNRAGCSRPMGITTDEDWTRVAPGPSRPWDQWGDMQTRMLVHAMACDLAPVGRLEVGGGLPTFNIPALDMELQRSYERAGADWHHWQHGQSGPDGPYRPQDPETTTGYDPRFLDSFRFYTQLFANLLTELDRFVEGPDGRTMLDNSLVIAASDLGDHGFGHHARRMGFVLAGNVGRFRTGYHLDCAPGRGTDIDSPADYTTGDLLATIVNACCVRDSSGAEITSFGMGGMPSSPLPLPTA
ncbi:MAG: DUF1552 domain-containing protein [Myxococcota bacterium]